MNLILREQSTNIYLLIFSVLAIIILAIIKQSSPKIFSFLVIGLLIPKYFKRADEIASQNKLINYIVLLIFIFIISLFISSLFAVNKLNLIALISISTVIYFIIKLIIIYISGNIFEQVALFKKYYEYLIYYIKSIGVICLPMIVINSINKLDILVYSNVIILNIVIFVVLTILFVLKIIQSIKVASLNKIASYQIILYICTLEISPLVLIFVFFLEIY